MALETSPRKSKRNAALAILLLIALGLRLGWALSRPVSDESIDALPDQREYLSLAQNLLHGKGLQFFDKRFDDTVHAFRMPGYPLLLAACRCNIRAARGVGAIIDSSTVLAVFLLATFLQRDRRNWAFPFLAATIIAFNPYLIYFSALLLSETLFTAMLLWSMVLLILGRGGRGPWRYTIVWLCGGLLLACSALVRPSAVALPVLLGIVSVFVNSKISPAYQDISKSSVGARRSTGSGRLGVGHDYGALTPAPGTPGEGWGGGLVKTVFPSNPLPTSPGVPGEGKENGYSSQVGATPWRLPVGTTMLLLTVMVLLPWAMRNRSILGRWIWLDTNSGFTLYDGYNPDATGASDQSFIDREPELQVLGEIDRSEYLSRKATRYASTHWRRVWDLAWIKLARTWSPVPLSSEYGRPGLRLIALAYSLPFDLLVLAALLWGNLPRSARVFLLAPAIYFSIIHALTVGSLRYRIPVEPAMAVLAASLIGAWGAAGQAWAQATGA